MSHSVTLSDALIDVAALVKAGDSRQAKRRTRELLNIADAESLSVIGRCASTLEKFPRRIAVEKLRHAWQTSNSEHRALIAACAPEQDNGQYRPEHEPAAASRYGRDNYQAPRNSRRWIDPSRRTAQRTQRQARQDATASRYFAERAGVAEGTQLTDRDDRARDEQVYASGLDYDKAGVPDVRGLPCVACWLERAAADVATERARAGHGDDGLCADCRESGRLPIPELPAGHTRVDKIETRCAAIAERTGDSARAILRREWKRYADPRDRATLAAWIQAHPLPETPAPNASGTPAAVVDGDCEQCGGIRQVRHRACLDCRKLDAAPSAGRRTQRRRRARGARRIAPPPTRTAPGFDRGSFLCAPPLPFPTAAPRRRPGPTAAPARPRPRTTCPPSSRHGQPAAPPQLPLTGTQHLLHVPCSPVRIVQVDRQILARQLTWT